MTDNSKLQFINLLYKNTWCLKAQGNVQSRPMATAKINLFDCAGLETSSALRCHLHVPSISNYAIYIPSNRIAKHFGN